jgi:hypothetical protein
MEKKQENLAIVEELSLEESARIIGGDQITAANAIGGGLGLVGAAIGGLQPGQ